MSDLHFNRALVELSISTDKYNVSLATVGPTGITTISDIVATCNFTPTGLMAAPTSSAFSMERGAAKALFQALWDVGLRPDKKIESDKSHIEALERHLSDMRKIAFAHCMPLVEERSPDKPFKVAMDWGKNEAEVLF
jgi:hypothetical protein